MFANVCCGLVQLKASKDIWMQSLYSEICSRSIETYRYTPPHVNLPLRESSNGILQHIPTLHPEFLFLQKDPRLPLLAYLLVRNVRHILTREYFRALAVLRFWGNAICVIPSISPFPSESPLPPLSGICVPSPTVASPLDPEEPEKAGDSSSDTTAISHL